MRSTRLVMGMPVTVEVVDACEPSLIDEIFAYFDAVDRRFSTYKADSEISAINRGEIAADDFSDAMKEVLALAATTRRETDGYFDERTPSGAIDPSGIVKGWAIRNAAEMLRAAGCRNFYVDAGGDIQSCGENAEGRPWRVGIRNPFDMRQIVKVIAPQGRGVATSGTYVRGQHIYNPHAPGAPIDDILSLTVLGSDVLEADRFATAAFAMGADGIGFIATRPDLEGYVIRRDGHATMTNGFDAYVVTS